MCGNMSLSTQFAWKANGNVYGNMSGNVYGNM